MLSVYQTAVEYHMYHALGIILIGVVINIRPGPSIMRWATTVMLVRCPVASIFEASVAYAG